MKTTVIYHSADYDGIFCREIARKFLPDAELIGWNFGDPPIAMPDGDLYVMDLPLDRPFGFKWDMQAHSVRYFKGNVVWIDHHKTSIDTHPKDISGYRIDGVAACRLAWQWFQQQEHWDVREMHPPYDLPVKEHYIDRNVLEPLAVRLAGEYDIWDTRDPRAELLQYGLNTDSNPGGVIRCLIDGDRLVTIDKVLDLGYVAQLYAKNTDASICKARTWLMKWEGLTFLCVNSARFNSLFFAAKDMPETGHDALLGFCYDGKCWTVSLYHAKHHTDLDLSEIAKKHGGGGHRGACGFTCKALPFSL